MKFSEKELEDWFCDNVQEAMSALHSFPHDYTFTLLGRQVKCEGGIIDLLILQQGETVGMDYHTGVGVIHVVELKATKAKRQDWEQLDRYMRCLKDSIWHCADTSGGQERLVRALNTINEYDGLWTHGTLVATSGDADGYATKDSNGFHIRPGKRRTPSFENDELEDLIVQHVNDNIKWAMGMDTGHLIRDGMRKVGLIE